MLSLVCLATHLAVGRTLATPGVAHGAVWLLVSLGYFIVYGDTNAISAPTLNVLMVGIAAFSIGIYAGGRAPQLPIPLCVGSGWRFPLQVVIVVVSAVGLGMMVYKAIQLAPPDLTSPWFGGGRSWFANLRDEINYSGAKGSFGLPGYFLNFSFASTAYLILYSRRHLTTSWLWPSIVLSLGFALLSTGRTHLVLLGCLVVGAAMPEGRTKRIILALALPLFGAGALLLVTLLKGVTPTTPTESLLDTLVNSQLKGYILTAVGAFDILVSSGMESTGGSMTFRTPLAVLRAFGLPVSVPEMIQDNVTFASFQINVYTAFSPYYRDFGVTGVGLFMGALGAIHGWVFQQLKSGMPIFIVANAILFYALFMQFFQDQYFSLMSQWIQILGWTYLFNKLQSLPVVRTQ